MLDLLDDTKNQVQIVESYYNVWYLPKPKAKLKVAVFQREFCDFMRKKQIRM